MGGASLHEKANHLMFETETNDAEPSFQAEPWMTPWPLPSERICGDCRYAHHKHLAECPICKELNR